MKNDIVFAGNLITDIMKRVNLHPSPGMLANILAVEQGIGGCACNNAIIYKRLYPNQHVQSAGLLGTDTNGDYVLNMLESQGIDTSLVCRTSEAPTSFTDVMTDDETHQRTFYQMRGTNVLYNPTEYRWEQVDTEIYFLGYILLMDALDAPDAEYGTVMARTLHAAQKRGFKTSTDVVSIAGNHAREVIASLPYCDYFFCNELDAEMTTGIPLRDAQGNLIGSAAYEAAQWLMDHGVCDTVLIHAPEGAWGMNIRGEKSHSPSSRLPEGFIKGTVGAGDAFCAGALGALKAGLPLQRVLTSGNAAAAMSLSRVNSFDGVLPMEVGLRLYDENAWAELI